MFRCKLCALSYDSIAVVIACNDVSDAIHNSDGVMTPNRSGAMIVHNLMHIICMLKCIEL